MNNNTGPATPMDIYSPEIMAWASSPLDFAAGKPAPSLQQPLPEELAFIGEPEVMAWASSPFNFSVRERKNVR